MKLLMLIVDESKKEELEVLLNRSGVVGYTEIPRTSAVIFTVLSEDALDRLVREIKEFCADCGERLKMIVWGVEEVL